MEIVEHPRPLNAALPYLNGPFPGPRAFRVEEELYFFGRDRDAVDLANMVAACPLTVVYGSSGSGKSSLINARLSQALEEIEPYWKVITFSSWQSGFESALLDLVGAELPKPVPAEEPEASAPAPRPDLAARLMIFARTSRRPVALVLDQFEEYFLYNRAGMEFQGALARLANRRSSPVHLVLCLRSDRLFLLDKLRAHIPEILQNLFVVDPLGGEGARRAVYMPVRAYGENMKQEFSVEPKLVEALVAGSSEREIFRQLPLHGRGEAGGGAAEDCEAGADGPMRIVAPFLQLALEAIWREDVIERGRVRLRLQTLRDLAGVAEDTAREALVGRLVQRHFDTVLSRRTAEEQDICARLFDRMVTYSGTKVAIAFPTDLSALTEPQLVLAGELLEWLSAPGPGRFVRPVAADEPGAGQTGGSFRRYEIVHDALAVPILDWVVRRREQAAIAEAAAQAAEREADERARREIAEARQEIERASREAAEARAAQERSWRSTWQVGSALAILIILLVTGYGYTTGEYRARHADVDRFLSFAADDPSPEFRTRLLLGVAALNRSAGLWSFVFEAEREKARQLLKAVLMRSPWFGGEYSAASVDASGTRVAMLLPGDPDKGLHVLALAKDATEDVSPLPANFNVTEAASRNSKLRQVPSQLVGFVDGLSAPVLIKQGMLYYRPEGTGPSDWQAVDLADLVPENLLNLPGFCFEEIVASAVQVTCIGNLGEFSIVRSRPAAPSGPRMWVSATQIANISPVRGMMHFAPAVSPLLPAAPWDRWATLFRSDANGSAAEGQYREIGITVGAFGEIRTNVVVWPDLTEKLQEVVQQAIDSKGATADPSLAFSDDGSSVVLRRERKIFLASLPAVADGAPLVKPRGDYTSLQVPDYLAGRATPGMWNQRPLLAAVRITEEGPAGAAGAYWRFAWLLSGGLVVMQSRDGESMLQAFQPWEPSISSIPKRAEALMFTGVAAGYRLNFSVDGRFLTLVSQDWERKVTQIRVWDLTPKVIGDLQALRTDVALEAAACGVAGRETGGSSFDTGERITWIGADGAQPCGS